MASKKSQQNSHACVPLNGALQNVEVWPRSLGEVVRQEQRNLQSCSLEYVYSLHLVQVRFFLSSIAY
jgi:hypothetical protein